MVDEKGEENENAHEGDDQEDKGGSLRRCIVTFERKPPDEMLRFVVGPDASVVFDVAGKLPGRGLWLSAGADMLQTATAKGAFARAAKAKVQVPDDLEVQVRGLLKKRCLSQLGLAKRAGQVTAGFEKVRARLKKGGVGVLIEAADGKPDGRGKLEALAKAVAGATKGETIIVALFERSDLAKAIGREEAVHLVLEPGRLAEGFIRDASKLAGVQGCPLVGNEKVNDGSEN